MADPHHLEQQALRLISAHLGDTWGFRFDRATKRAGLCDYRARQISVSRYFAARYGDDDMLQVVLHEIAHAIAGPSAGHGASWLRIARSIGYTGGVTHPGQGIQELAPWVGVCPAGHVIHRHRKTRRPTSCARCSARFDERHLIVWHRREITPADRAAAAVPR